MNDKNLLLANEIITKEKYRIKKINWAQSRRTMGGGGPRRLDSSMGGISSDWICFFLVKHQAASANG
jgi:hypothetical protein